MPRQGAEVEEQGQEKGLRYWGSAGLAAWEEGTQPGERMCYGEKIMRG